MMKLADKYRGLGAAHGHVVDRAADGEPSDVATCKKEGMHDVCVAAHDGLSLERRHYSAVVGLRKIGVAKGLGK